MCVFDFLAKLLGPKGALSKKYASLESWLHGKITPGEEYEVNAQLDQLVASVPQSQKNGVHKYIESGAWKSVFVKKEQ